MNRLSELSTISGSGGRVAISPGGRLVLVADGVTNAPDGSGSDGASLGGAVRGAIGGAIDDAVGSGSGVRAAVERLAALGHRDVVVIERIDDMAVIGFRGDVVVGWIVGEVERFARPVGVDTVCDVQVPAAAAEIAVALGSTVPARGESLEMRAVADTGTSPAGRVHVDLTTRPADVALPPPQLPPPPPPTPPSPSPVPEGMELVNFTVAVPAGVPLPVGSAGRAPEVSVLGIRCPLDHHNHPEAEYCSSCGRKMGVNATAVFVQGPRPPVGLLLTASGEAIPLAGDLVIGREPTSHADVVDRSATPVHIDDQTHVVSRHHVAITLDGWDVFVSDLGSANGTVLASGRTGLERRLSAGERVRMDADDEIRLGEHAFRLALHHIARR